MESMPLDLLDLVPKETTFKLASFENTFTLCKFSLRVRSWATKTYGSARLKEIFDKQEIIEIAEIAWFMLKEKSLFKDDKEQFLEAIGGPRDQLNLIKALLGAVGIGEPEMKKIDDAAKEIMAKKAEEANQNPPPRPKKKTGAKSSTR